MHRLDGISTFHITAKQKQHHLHFSFSNGEVRSLTKITIKFFGMEVSAQGVLSVVLAAIIALAALAVIWAYLNKHDIQTLNRVVSLTQLVI